MDVTEEALALSSSPFWSRTTPPEVEALAMAALVLVEVADVDKVSLSIPACIPSAPETD